MIIYLSPHLDDAVYACGGLIAAQTRAGEHVEVWTVFAGDPPAGRISPFARSMHERWELAGPSFSGRRAEDETACAMLGAKCRHYPYRDAIYRRAGRRGRLLYPTHSHVFGRLLRSDRVLSNELAARLERELPQDADLVCPLGLGHHVDHALTRLVAERLGRPLTYYQDLPYAVQKSGQNDQVTDRAWQQEVVALSADALGLWRSAAAAYQSQLALCWETEGGLHEALGAYAKDAGGLRLWRRKTPTAQPEQDGATSVLLVPHQLAKISPAQPAGGGAAAIFDLAQALCRAGCRVTVACELSEDESFRRDGVDYYNLSLEDGLERNLSALSDRRFDAVIAQRGDVMTCAARYFPFSVRILRLIDTFWRTHNVPPEAVNHCADAVVAVSQFIRGEATGWGVDEAKIRVINDGLRTDLFRPDPDNKREDNLIVFAGATIRDKGILILLRAFGLLTKQMPDVRLEVYGSGALWRQQKEDVDWRDIQSQYPNISYQGAVGKAALAEAFNRAALCVIPSIIMEGFTRVSTEAQGCGCPVVATRAGGLAESLIDGETGIIVDPLSPRALADAIHRLLADSDLRQRMSRRAAQRAARFSTDDSARAFLELVRMPRTDPKDAGARRSGL